MSGEFPFDPSVAGFTTQPKSEPSQENSEVNQEGSKEKSPAERLQSLKEANTLAIDVPFKDIQAMKAELETKLGIPLQDRGEAHITLIRPIDAKILREGLLTPEDLKAFDECVGKPVEISGIGTIPPNLDAAGVKSFTEVEKERASQEEKFNPKGVVFFAVIRLPEGVQAKLDALIDLVNAKQPNPKKHVGKINPHVTIGFTQKDRFDGSKAETNPNFEKPNVAIHFENVVAQKPIKDAEGNQTTWPDGTPASKYEPV